MDMHDREHKVGIPSIMLGVALLLPLTFIIRHLTHHEFFGFQDEGDLLTFPDLILRGYHPYVDFNPSYSPGNFYVLAVIYRIFGESVFVERVTSAVYWFLTIFALFLIGLRVSRATAFLTGLTAVGYMSLFTSPGAHAHFVAYATTLFALLLVSKTAERDLESGRKFAFLAGVLVGATGWFKQDIGIMALVSAITGFTSMEFRRLGRFFAGLALPACAMLAFGIFVGPGNLIDGLVVDLLRMEPGRVVPVELNLTSVVLSIYTAINVGGALITSTVGVPRHLNCLLRSIAALSVSLAIGALHRLGPTDISYLGTIVVSLALVTLRIALIPWGYSRNRIATISVMGFLAGLSPIFLVHHIYYSDATPVPTALVFSEGRTVPWGLFDDSDGSPQPIMDKINELSKAGQKLFVGSSDLRFANNNDVVFYYLLPKLRPASRYIEMNPGSANRADSGLAADVFGADWVILTSQFIHSEEPNGSAIPGSPAPNEVIRSHFCVRSRHAYWQLLEHCS